MPLAIPRIIDISIDLDASNFRMRTYEGFKKDMQFEVEVIKDYPGGLGQIVRGAHMRLHAGSHVDAPSHMLKGAKDVHEIPLTTFIGDAVVADIRHCRAGEPVGVADLERSVGKTLRRGDRLLLRTDQNQQYNGSPEWMARAPYMSDEATAWCIGKGIVIIGFDFYHAAYPSGDQAGVARSAGQFARAGILTMPYLKNLGEITKERVTLVALPLKMIGVEASPVRAIVLEE